MNMATVTLNKIRNRLSAAPRSEEISADESTQAVLSELSNLAALDQSDIDLEEAPGRIKVKNDERELTANLYFISDDSSLGFSLREYVTKDGHSTRRSVNGDISFHDNYVDVEHGIDVSEKDIGPSDRPGMYRVLRQTDSYSDKANRRWFFTD